MIFLNHEFRSGYPVELLYADDIVLIAEGIEELNMKRQKIMVSDTVFVRSSGKWVGGNSVCCVFLQTLGP